MNLKHFITKKTLLILAILPSFFSFAQEQDHFCGQMEHNKKFYKDNPNLAPEKNPAYKELEEFTKNFKTSYNNKIGLDNLQVGYDYIIPVVVHVIHNNGPENLSDPAIKRAIDLLNYFFSGVTANDSFITPAYKPIRGIFTGKKIRFVLAKFDPSGNPTNGIDRKVDATYTLDGSNEGMRTKYKWPRANYFNIYVVRRSDVGGSSGFATFPADVVNKPDLDGHVMSFWAFGEHGAMANSWTHNLNHEVGHWLNLFHIWGANSNNGDANNCNNPNNDSVSDTPLTKGNKISKPIDFPAVNPKTCGVIDDLSNMMDYTSGIYASITVGQKARMEAALNSSVSDRNKLWSTANVLAKLYGCTTGTDSDGDLIPDACDVCPNSASNDSDGDGICDNVDSCAGLPDVNVDANPLASDACDPLTPIINFNNKTILKYDAPTQDKGLHVTYDGGATLYTATNAWKAVDLNYTITPNTVLEFDFMSTIDGEDHSIGIDDNLTMNPLLSFKLYGTKAITTTAVYKNNYNTYTDSDRYNYKHYKIPVGTFYTGSAPYLFFTCNNDLYINPTWSNNFYDGLGRFYDGTSFFRNVKMYENTVLSTANFNYEKDIYFYPNPTNNSFKIVLENNMSMDKIMIYDVQGRVVYQKDLYQSNQEQVDINYLEAGVYHVKIETNKGVLSKKVIKN